MVAVPSEAAADVEQYLVEERHHGGYLVGDDLGWMEVPGVQAEQGVICDGISRDLAHTLTVMDEFDLEYAELQFVWDKEVGDHSKQEIAAIKELLKKHNKPVSCLSRHVFAGMTTANRPGDALHVKHMDALKRVSLMSEDRNKGIRVMLSGDKLSIETDTPEVGEAREDIEVDYDGGNLRIGFNAGYLVDALARIDGDEVFVEFNEELDPCVLRPVESENFLGVVMPLRL